MLYDIIILGGGPAGTAAAVYSARKKLKTLLITESFGGQSIVSDDIENWIGEKHISGLDLARKLEEHVRAYSEDIEIKTPERAVAVRRAEHDGKDDSHNFEVETNTGDKYRSRAVILAMGARRRHLGVTGEDKFEGKGVSYCATCDAPLFKGKKVAVVGGGNAGLESAIDLLPYAEEIFILETEDSLRADPITKKRVESEAKVTVILSAAIKEILGNEMVSGLMFKNKKGSEHILSVEGVFVEIGSVPNAESVRGLLELDRHGQIKIDSKHASTSEPGVFAAGDVTDNPYKQNNVSVGDAIKAALAAYAYLQKSEKMSPSIE